MKSTDRWVITRRDFLKTSIVAGISAAAFGNGLHKAFAQERLRFGIVSDTHYADASTKYGRYYRESIDKMTECVDFMNKQKVDFLVELGDFKDENSFPVEEKNSFIPPIHRKLFSEVQWPHLSCSR